MTSPQTTATSLFLARRTQAFGRDLSLAICRRDVSLSLFSFRNLPFRTVLAATIYRSFVALQEINLSFQSCPNFGGRLIEIYRPTLS